MPRTAKLLVSAGFLWIALWAVAGSLLGARINHALSVGDSVWIQGLQRELLRTAHAHMNTLSYGVILMGLSWTQARRCVSERMLCAAALAAVAGTPVFGAGLVVESFFPTREGALSAATALSAAGGLAVIFAFGAWGVFFLRGATKL